MSSGSLWALGHEQGLAALSSAMLVNQRLQALDISGNEHTFDETLWIHVLNGQVSFPRALPCRSEKQPKIWDRGFAVCRSNSMSRLNERSTAETTP
jgi:hypothetical protein